jgi:glycosyltransferase involved in cell wall biosynthesis
MSLQIASPRHAESFNPKLELIGERVAFRNAVADWCLRGAQRSMRSQRIEEALQWNALAALAFVRGCNPLVSETLEQNLLEIAQRLPRFEWHVNADRGAVRRWLHVIDVALPCGGLTAMAQRWITRDPSKRVHSIALLAQDQPVPDGLAEAVRKSGGEILIRDPNMSLLSSAIWLRKFACAKADCVVLHVLNENVIAPTAFGVNGGPPVLLVNHAAHIFWTGAASVDITLNCRGSELEHYWTERYRGIPRSATLPIPIPPPERCTDGVFFTAESRDQARRRLGLPADAVVLLSVGRGEKYEAIPGLDFFEVARSLLLSCPQAYLLVVGPEPRGRWKELQTELKSRLAAVGLQSDLRDYHAAADIYIEGFPFGSTTALLEAGVHGIPCVLAPAGCPPPFGTDGIALDDVLHRPANVEEYTSRVKELIADPAERIRRGKSLAQSIGDHHCGAGWTRYLFELIAVIPEIHATRPVVQPPSPPEHLDHYWTQYVARREQNLLLYLFGCAASFGLTPTLDLPMYRAYRRARRVRRHDGRRRVSAPVVLTLLLPLCPPVARNRLSRKVSSLCGDDGVIANALRMIRGQASLARLLPFRSRTVADSGGKTS